jgi:hypothetical protein
MDFEVTFGTPEHGWLAIEIGASSGRQSNEVADVPDALTMLVKSLVQVATGGAPIEISWALEPHDWRWSFSPEGNDVLFTAIDPSRKTPLEARMPRRQLLDEFSRSLIELESRSCWTDSAAENADWSYPFPNADFALLRSLLSDAEQCDATDRPAADR